MPTDSQFQVVCGLYAQHPHHVMHTRPCTHYSEAIDLAADLNGDLGEPAATHPLFQPCLPFRVQQAVTTWEDVR